MQNKQKRTVDLEIIKQRFLDSTIKMELTMNDAEIWTNYPKYNEKTFDVDYKVYKINVIKFI